MRCIKFRAWDIEEKKMIEHNSQELVFIPCFDNLGADTHFKTEGWGDIDISHFDWASADLICRRFEIMQFTGLKDKNGIEMYEGDICLATLPKERFTVTIIYELSIAGFLFQWPDNTYESGMDEMTIDCFTNIKVVGNIYENPELIKEN